MSVNNESGTIRSDIHDILALELVGHSGESVSLKNIFTEISINESIFTPSCTGTIVILESDNLVEELPIIGEETLIIAYTGLHSDDIIERSFYVYALATEEDESGQGAAHTLKFCSHEVLANKSQRISRAFNKLAPSSIVSKILKTDIGSDKKIDIERASNTIEYIAPNISPFAVISQVATRSHSIRNGDGALYLFYEDADGYNFKSVESMFNAPSYNYTIGDQGLSDNMMGDDSIILAHSYENVVNTMNNISTGVFGNNYNIIDLDKKELVAAGFNYFDDKDFKSVPRVNGETGRRVSPNIDTSKGGITSTIVGTDINRDLSMGRRQNRIATITNGPKLNVEVPINIMLRAGSTIEIHKPTNDRDDTEIPGDDEIISGVYLVTSLKQVFYQHSGISVLSLSKDGVGVVDNSPSGKLKGFSL